MTGSFSVAQLHLLRSLDRGFEKDFVPIFLERCGATWAEYDALVGAGYVAHDARDGHVRLSEAGRRAYRRGKVGRYF